MNLNTEKRVFLCVCMCVCVRQDSFGFSFFFQTFIYLTFIFYMCIYIYIKEYISHFSAPDSMPLILVTSSTPQAAHTR